MKRGFTFIEILVVIAVLAVLAAIVVLILNPAEYLRRARDAQRLSDATHINQAMALYNYGTAFNNKTQDSDGPRFPIAGSPPTTDSCKNDPIPHRLFVSVPKDNGETPPVAPTDWQYAQVSSTQLRAVNGSGWLPVDFTQASGAQPPLSVLPVDPVNNFASGYYYSYGCGSWNINMRFESTKYADLATTDGGTDTGVFELGTDLSVLPRQDAYHPTSTVAVTPGTLPPILPSGDDQITSWTINPNGPNAYSVVNDINDTGAYIWTSTNGAIATFAIPAPAPIGIIGAVRLKILANQQDSSGRYTLKPYLKSGASPLPNSSYAALNPTVDISGTTYGLMSFDLLAPSGGQWSWSDFDNLKIGVIVQKNSAISTLRVTKVYLEVDYH